MPGRNPEEAFRAFLAPMERVLRCVTLQDRLTATNAGPLSIVTFNGEPIVLSNDYVDFDFHFAMTLESVRTDDRTQWRMSTRSYIYEIHEREGEKRHQIVRWHWHPNAGRYIHPHLHLPSGAKFSSQFHVPTGRVTFEDVVGSLIGELGVVPVIPNWQAILDETRSLHVRHRSWSHQRL